MSVHKHVLAAAIGVGAALTTIALLPRHANSDIYPPSDVPGVVNPNITQANLNETLCNPIWSTKSIRPSTSYTGPLKIADMAKYGLQTIDPKNIELDHLISLELGGAPTDPKNLWPEKRAAILSNGNAEQKDRVENLLHSQVCAGTITLSQAQKEITHDWFAVYNQAAKNPTFGSIENITRDTDDN